MSDSVLLREATVQEIQLELIRRMQYNAFDGEQVFASLMKHRDLWQAVLLDRQGALNYQKPGHLQMGGLIKLRDLDGNFWNVDELFILTTKREHAIELARIIKEEDWGGQLIVYDDQEQIDSALGGSSREHGLLSIWWD